MRLEYTEPTGLSKSFIEAGTANGQLLFWTDPSWVHSETTELHWDDTTKKLSANGFDIPAKSITVADFTSAGIIAAIAALGSYGGEVYLPAGDYDLTAGIVLDDNVVLRGSGKGTRLLATNRATYTAVTGVPADGETLSGDTTGFTATCVKVDLTNKVIWYVTLSDPANYNNGEVISWSGGADTTLSALPTGQTFDAISATTKVGCTVKDLYIVGGSGGGSSSDLILFTGCTDCKVQDCWIEHSDSNGVYATNSSGILFDNIIAANNDWSAIGFNTPMLNSTISNCRVNSGVRGIRICGDYSSAINNIVTGIGNRGLLLCSGDGLIARGNTLNDSTLDIGCYYDHVRYALVADNVFYGSGIVPGIIFIGSNIGASYNTTDCIIRDNTFENFTIGVAFNPENGGSLGVVARNTVQDNKFITCPVGISLVAGEDVNDNSLIMNEFYDCTNDIVDNGANTNIIAYDEGNVSIKVDDKKLYFGAGDDASVTFNGSELIITGNTVCAADTVQLVGTTITNTGQILATDKVIFTQVDGNEYIDSLNDGFVDYGATTAHRFLADVKIPDDTKKLYLGGGDDASLTYNGTDLLINPRAVGSGNTSFTGNVGIGPGTSNCEYLVDINGAGTTEGFRMYSNSFLEMRLLVNSNTAAARGMYRTTRSRGTKALPLALQSGDSIFSFIADGHSGTSYAGAGEIDCIATQNWGVAARGNKWVFQNVTNNLTVAKEALVIEHDGVIQTINKVSFTQTDQNEYIDSLADGFMDYGATTAHRFDNDVKIPADSKKLYLGAADDASMTFNGAELILTGNEVTASDSVGIVGTTVTTTGQVYQDNGTFAAVGDALGSTKIVRATVNHVTANWYPLFTDGSAGQMTMHSDTVWTFDILLVGTTSGCTKSFGFKIEGVIENDGGTTTILASTVTTLYDTDDTDFDARVAADDATDALCVEVTDSTSGSDVVRWVAKVSAAEVSY